jgi:uncharacterized DUF497 family protein
MPKFGWDKAKAERNFRRHKYTLRSGVTRIISARLAEPRESRRYHEAKR